MPESLCTLIEGKRNLDGYHLQKVYLAQAYQGSYDHANSRDLIYADYGGERVISLTKSLIRKLAKTLPDPKESDTRRWKIKIVETVALVGPNLEVFLLSYEGVDEAQKVLEEEDSSKIIWTIPCF